MADEPERPASKALEKLAGALIAAGDNPNLLEELEKIEDKSTYYEHIGQIAIHWATFEITADYGTLKLGGIHLSKGLCLTSQISGIARKLDAFISMAKLDPLPDQILRKFKKFSDKARGLAERRNRVIHDAWTFTKSGAFERMEITARSELRVRFVKTKLQELNDLITQIDDIGTEFESLVQLIEGARPTTPGNQP